MSAPDRDDEERQWLDAAESGLYRDLEAARLKRRIVLTCVIVGLFGVIQTFIVLTAVRCAQ